MVQYDIILLSNIPGGHWNSHHGILVCQLFSLPTNLCGEKLDYSSVLAGTGTEETASRRWMKEWEKITNDSSFPTSRHDSDKDTQFSVILWRYYNPQRSRPWGLTYNSVIDNFLRISPDLCARAPDPQKKLPLRQQSSKLLQASVQCLEHSKILEEHPWKQFSSLLMECRQNIDEVLFLLSKYMEETSILVVKWPSYIDLLLLISIGEKNKRI